MPLFDINIELFKKVKEKKHCLCNLKKTCPCDEFLETHHCGCGVFKNVEMKLKVPVSERMDDTDE